MSMQGGTFLSTDQVEPSLRNDFWRAVTRIIFDVGVVSPDGQLKGAILSRTIGCLTITAITSNRQQYVRDQSAVTSDGFGHYMLCFIVSGTMTADCDQTSLFAEPGDICLFDLAQPFQSKVEAGARISLVIPRERIDSVTNGHCLHGLHLRSKDPLVGMLRSLILQLHNEADAIISTDMIAAETAIIDFIATIVANKALKHSSGESTSKLSLHQHMLQYIDSCLTDPDLGPAELMRQFRVSRAHLYRVFAPNNGVASVIRDRRLDMAYRHLRARGMQSRTLTELSYELGFSSSGIFSRSFKARFGISPRDVTAGMKPANGTTPLQAHFARLMKCWAIKRDPQAVEALLMSLKSLHDGNSTIREPERSNETDLALLHHAAPL